MKRVLLFGVAAVLVLGLASTGHASFSHFMVSGSLSQTGYAPQGFSGDSTGPWSKSVAADDIVADGVSVTDSGSLVKQWSIGWATAPGFSTVYKVDYTIDRDLFTEILGDWASGNVTVKLELPGVNPDQDIVAAYVADGETLTDQITGSVSLSTPSSPISGSNWGTLKLTISLGAEAFKEAVPVQPDPPVVPAPGAIVLSSLGAGLIGWLRRKHAL